MGFEGADRFRVWVTVGWSARDGEADSGGALNAGLDSDGRLWIWVPSPERIATRAAWPTGGELGEPLPRSLAALRAEIGLAPVVGPMPWKDDRLP